MIFSKSSVEFGIHSQLAQFVVKELKRTKVVEEKKTNDVLMKKPV